MHLQPFSDRYRTDPSQTWNHILTTGPHVSYDMDLDLWLIAGHDNVRTALSDTRRFSNAATLAPIRPLTAETGAVLAGFDAPDVAASADGSQHARMRAILRTYFPNTADRARQSWGMLITKRVDQLAGEFAGHSSIDLMQQFATRLPLVVILDILGIPAADMNRIPGWSDGFVSLIWGDLDPAAQLDAAHGFVTFWQTCRQLVEQRAARSDDDHPDLIGDLLRHRAGDDIRLSTDEIAALVLNLIVAGWETTSSALGHALEHALADPDRWAKVADDAHYLATHVEESLRHSPAIDGWQRLTTADVVLGDTTIPAGSRCLVLIGTANHDPRLFTQPRTFEPRRARLSQHLSFGAGVHYCIGASLARLELTTALQTLARRLPTLRLAAGYEHRFQPNAAARTHTTLPATTEPNGCPVRHAATESAT